VPFFGDEVYAWFFGGRPAKYDKKEWKSLWAAVWELRVRLGKEAENVEARDVERAATVLYWAAEGRLESVAGAGEGENDKEGLVGKGKVVEEQALEKKGDVKPAKGKKRASTSSKGSEIVEPKKRRRR
jgi:hypothetical protein